MHSLLHNANASCNQAVPCDDVCHSLQQLTCSVANNALDHSSMTAHIIYNFIADNIAAYSTPKLQTCKNRDIHIAKLQGAARHHGCNIAELMTCNMAMPNQTQLLQQPTPLDARKYFSYSPSCNCLQQLHAAVCHVQSAESSWLPDSTCRLHACSLQLS